MLHTQQQCALSFGARAMAGSAPAAPHAPTAINQLMRRLLAPAADAADDQANELVQGQIAWIYSAGQGTDRQQTGQWASTADQYYKTRLDLYKTNSE